MVFPEANVIPVSARNEIEAYTATHGKDIQDLPNLQSEGAGKKIPNVENLKQMYVPKLN